MKKIAVLLFVVMVALSAKAQVYVGGTIGLWHDDDADATTFLLSPEVGYNLNAKWAVGVNLTYIHLKSSFDLSNESFDAKLNGFAFAPYARYSFYENKIVRLFVDGGVGFSTYKYDIDGADSTNGFEIGIKPGVAIKLNKSFSLVAKCGFLGYRDDYMYGDNGYGLNFSGEDLSFGFQYNF